MNGVRWSDALRWLGVALVALLLAGLTWALVRAPAHAGEHYVAGGQATGTLRANTQHRECIYLPELEVAKIPVVVNVHGDGAVTFHVNATFSLNGRLVASEEADYPAKSMGGRNIDNVAIPIDRDRFDEPGVFTCGVTSVTSSPGAWFPTDD